MNKNREKAKLILVSSGVFLGRDDSLNSKKWAKCHGGLSLLPGFEMSVAMN